MNSSLPWQAFSSVPKFATFTEPQKAQFQQLYDTIVQQNKTLNLTRITDPTEFLEKHIWDSVAGIVHLEEKTANLRKILDIGTGGGFPGIPLAIAYPHAAVTLLDATQKKVLFLQELIQHLQLSQVSAIAERAEILGQDPQHRETYDLAVLRAVAAPAVCAEYALPLLKVGGIAVLYRGQWTPEEEQHLQTATPQLGGKVLNIYAFKTPLTHSERHCVYLEKIKPTRPEFPRRVGVPRQKPLGGK